MTEQSVPADVAFDEKVRQWLSGLISHRNDCRLSNEMKVLSDSDNFHRIDHVIEKHSFRYEKKADWEEKVREVDQVKSRFDSYGGITKDNAMEHLSDFVQFSKLVKDMEAMFTWAPKVLVETKWAGRDGNAPADTTFRQYLIEGYAELADYRNQKDLLKILIVPYKPPSKGYGFNYDRYFQSVGIHYISIYNEDEKKLVEERIKEI
jgi:hypothetical protein